MIREMLLCVSTPPMLLLLLQPLRLISSSTVNLTLTSQLIIALLSALQEDRPLSDQLKSSLILAVS